MTTATETTVTLDVDMDAEVPCTGRPSAACDVPASWLAVQGATYDGDRSAEAGHTFCCGQFDSPGMPFTDWKVKP